MESKPLANQSSPAADIETATETNPARPDNSLFILSVIQAASLVLMGGSLMFFILAWNKALVELPALWYWYYAIFGSVATLLFAISYLIQRSAGQLVEDPDEQGVPAAGTGPVFMHTAGSIRYHRTVCSQLEGIPFPYMVSPKWQELTPKEVFAQNLLPCEICKPPVIARVQYRYAPIESQVGAAGV